jgi:SAM-dependent methyltransferase
MFGVDVSRRCRLPEVMDQPGLDERRHRQALRGLERVNALSRSSGILWPEIRRLAGQRPDVPLRVLDVACGAGDVALDLLRKAGRAGVKLSIAGCDISPTALRFARERASQKRFPIEFFECDVLRGELPEGFDVVMCSLFLHHLTEEDALQLMRRMAAAAGRLVLINDLRRSQAGYWLAWLGSRILSRSDVVHTDAPLSVRAAFTGPEVLELAHRAGLEGGEIRRCWPQRFLFRWSRP